MYHFFKLRLSLSENEFNYDFYDMPDYKLSFKVYNRGNLTFLQLYLFSEKKCMNISQDKAYVIV